MPVASSRVREVDGRKLGYVRLADLQRGRPRLAAQGGRKGASAKGPRGSCSTCARNGGGLLDEAVLTASIFLPEDEVVVTTDSRTQGHADYGPWAATCRRAADRRPDRPQHRLRGGDPDRGAGRRRRRDGGRHALLRQGRLPAGDRPLQRRRAEADDRRVLHARRREPGRATGSSPTCRARDLPGTERDEALDRALEVLVDAGRQGPRREPAPAGARPRPGAGGAPRNARDAVEALLREELGGRGFRASLEIEARRAAGTAAERSPRPAPRPDRAADLHRRPGDRARLRRRGLGPARGRRRPALDPHRRRRRPRAAGLAARPRGAAARQQHLRAGHGRADAAARAERGRLQPGAGGRAARGHGGDRARRRTARRGRASFYRSRIRSDARLDYDELDVDLRRPRATRRRRSPSRSRSPARRRRRSASAAAPTSLDVESFEPEFRFDSSGNVVGARARRRRPSRTG